MSRWHLTDPRHYLGGSWLGTTPWNVQIPNLAKTLLSCRFHLSPHKWNESPFLVAEVFPRLAFLPGKCHFCKELSCFLSFGLWFSCSANVQAALALGAGDVCFCFIKSLKHRLVVYDPHIFLCSFPWLFRSQIFFSLCGNTSAFPKNITVSRTAAPHDGRRLCALGWVCEPVTRAALWVGRFEASQIRSRDAQVFLPFPDLFWQIWDHLITITVLFVK